MRLLGIDCKKKFYLLPFAIQTHSVHSFLPCILFSVQDNVLYDIHNYLAVELERNMVEAAWVMSAIQYIAACLPVRSVD